MFIRVFESNNQAYRFYEAMGSKKLKEQKARKFKILLEDELSFVEDVYFIIGHNNQRINDRSWYLVEGFQLFKASKGLSPILDASYIENGKKLNNFLKPYITPEGKVCCIIMG